MTDGQVIQVLELLKSAVETGAAVGVLLENPAIVRPLVPALVDPIKRELARGGTLASGLAATGALRRHEVVLVEAGERSGKLVDSLALVMAGVRRRVSGRRRLMQSLAYPSLLVCVAWVVMPIPIVVSTGFGAYALRAVWGPLLVGAAWGLFAVYLPSLPPESVWRRLPNELLGRAPFLGSLRRRQANATFAAVLGSCLDSGLAIGAAVESAAGASGDTDLQRRSAAALARIERGATLSRALESSARFDDRFVAIVAQGEATGTLVRALQAYSVSEEEAARVLSDQLTRLLTGLVIAGVMASIGWQVVTAFKGVVDQIDTAIEHEIGG